VKFISGLFSGLKQVARFIIAIPVASLAVVMTRFTNFVYVAEMVSLFPFRTGDLIRNKFYKWTLIGFVKKVTINFETIIS